MRTAQTWLWYASIAAQAALVIRLFTMNLYCQYKGFAAFLVASVIRSAFLVSAQVRTEAYFQIWLSSELLILGLQAWAVIEAYQLSMENYRTDRREPVFVLGIAALLAASSAFGTRLLDQPPGAGWDTHLHEALIFKKTVLAILLVIMWSTLWFFHRYPISISDNLRAHRRIMLAYLAQAACGYMLMAIAGRRMVPAVNVAMMGVSALCFVAWALLLRRSGEFIAARIAAPGAQAEVEARIAGYEEFIASRPWRVDR